MRCAVNHIAFMRNERGSALILVAVLLVVVGLFSAGVFALLRPETRETQEVETRNNMAAIVDAVAVYLQKHGRIPCPADPDRSSSAEPFGAERGSGSAGDAFGSCSGADRVGIVPFMTLGLPEEIAKDGWHHFITYRGASTPTDTSKIHQLCRTYTPGAAANCAVHPNDWVCPPSRGGSGNKNLAKALFCCGPIDGGFDVVDIGATSMVYPGGSPPAPTGANGYGPINSTAPLPSIPAGATLPDPLALVLISHGRNGGGAFLEDGSQMSTVGLTAEEAQNASLGGIFVWKVRTEASSGYFDDMVEWRTYDMLQTELGNSGYTSIDCSTPY